MAEIYRDDGTHTDIEIVDGKQRDVNDMLLARNISEILHRKYPRHLWAVHVNSEGGVVNIFNWRVSYKYGWVFKYVDLTPFDSQAERKVCNAGGELLERAYLKRGRATGENAEFVDGIKKKPRGIIV